MDSSVDQKTLERYKDAGLAMRNEHARTLVERLKKETQAEALRMLDGDFSADRFLELRGKAEILRTIANEAAVFESVGKRLEGKPASAL